MEFCVFGAGSLGTLIGGLLARAHDVTLIGREPHVSAIEREGLQIKGAISETVSPSAMTAVDESLAPDCAIVTVKAFDTEMAARELTTCRPDVVCSLQNGVGNEAVLAEQHSTVLAGTATYGATVDPGIVRCTGIGEIQLGSPDGAIGAPAERVGAAFTAAGLHCSVVGDMPRRLWEKLAVNAGINAVTALARIHNGGLASGPGHEIAVASAREAVRVAQQNDIALTESTAIEALERVIEATAANDSSMRQDMRAQKRTEIDAINGVIADYDDTPVNTTLAALVRSFERERGLRDR